MIRVHLTAEQRRILRACSRQELCRISERIHFALLSDQSKSPLELADLFATALPPYASG